MRTEKELEGVTLLGNQGTKYSDQYNPDVLETFENKHPENEYLVTFNCPEFTTLCPKTGQPDFGHLLMDPKYLEVTGWFIPRGDISIYPFANYADKDHEELKKQRLLEQFKEATRHHS